ncbi:MAG: Methyltransferase [Myxococcaceae bacterium]|nr:Methyltransferase [Myxococcaceae bacterium]
MSKTAARTGAETASKKPRGKARDAHEQRIARGAVAHYEDAAYYDLAYKRRRSDVRFYVHRALGSKGPVLELGAGTGRVALEIARAGRDIVAVEPVPAMLTRAREKALRLPKHAQERLIWKRGDLRTLRLAQRFALVIAPFNVFMHLYTREDLERGLATVRAHLAPRGRFVFDVSMPDLRAMVRSPGRMYKGPRVVLPDSGQTYDYFEAFDYDAVREVQLVSMVFQSASTLEDLRILPLSQRQFFPEELALLLHYNGFAIEQRFGDFDESPLARDSESQIVVARAR